MNRISTLFLTLFILVAAPATAAPKKYNITGKLKGAKGYVVLLVQKGGTSKSAAVKTSGVFSFKKVALSTLKGSSLQLIDSSGRYAGPIVLGTKGSRASITFSGKAPTGSEFELGTVSVKSGYGVLRKKQLATSVYSNPSVKMRQGKPLGAGELGLVSGATQGASIRAVSTEAGEDPDRDGVLSAFDVDDDGDLILDSADPDSRGTDIPYTGLVFDFRRTLNAHVRSGLSDTAIDAVVSGENVFALTFFFALSDREAGIDGGFVECDDSLTYCRRNTPLAFYGGVSESTAEFRNRPWSELLTAAGYPRMERISVGSFPAIVASIQPRVGRDVFRPGDVYRVNLTQGATVRSTRTLALAPYFVSIPAMKEYDAGSGTVAVDYGSVSPESGSIPGTSTGDPIILSPSGLLTVSFWRPQRQALRSDESGYIDWGNLNYGVVFDQQQATCAGLYTLPPGSDLTEVSNALGNGGSPLAQEGAKLSPLRDGQGDRATAPTNLITFTVDLKTCATRAGLAPGTYNLSLRAAGEQVTGGEVSAVQSFAVTIP